MTILKAPWSQPQVDAINRYQTSAPMHPFTCEHHPNRALFACSSELYCSVPNCRYFQEWVHDWMANWK